MYEPIRRKSVHTVAEQEFPHHSREEELDIQLAGHLTALLAVTDELRMISPPAAGRDLESAASRIAEQVTRLRRGLQPVRTTVPADGARPDPTLLHQRAHTLAGRALVVAASRADTAAAILAAECMDAHTAALGVSAAPSAPGVPAAR